MEQRCFAERSALVEDKDNIIYVPEVCYTMVRLEIGLSRTDANLDSP